MFIVPLMTIQAYRRDYAWTRAEKRNVTFPAEEPQPQGGPRRRSNIHDLTLQTGGGKAQRPPLAWNEWIFTNGQVRYFGKTPQRAIQRIGNLWSRHRKNAGSELVPHCAPFGEMATCGSVSEK